MKLTLLFDRGSRLRPGFIDFMEQGLKNNGHEISTVVLNREEIKPCKGCFNCWLLTPGRCVVKNDPVNEISKSVIRSDAAVIVSEVTYGGYSPDTKAFMDRFIPNVLPFFKIYNGEMHHEPCYPRRPIWVSIGMGDINEAERRTFIEYAERNAKNLLPPKHLVLTAKDTSCLSGQMKELLNCLKDEGDAK